MAVILGTLLALAVGGVLMWLIVLDGARRERAWRESYPYHDEGGDLP